MEPELSEHTLPSPALVTFQRIQAITCRGNLRIRVLADGALYAQVERGNCARGESWSGPWPARAGYVLSDADLRALQSMLESPAFFELPAHISTLGHDGYRDEIEVTLGPQQHQVTVERTEPPLAFAVLRDDLMQLAAPLIEGDQASNAT